MEKKIKNIFVLHILEAYFVYGERSGYHFQRDVTGFSRNENLGFQIYTSQIGYYESLHEAELRIKKIANEKDENLYGFVVEEKPIGFLINGFCFNREYGQNLSFRRYLKNGKIWQKSDLSTISCYDEKDDNLGDTAFRGCDSKTIPFKEGDIVEIARKDFVLLAIIVRLPPTKAKMKIAWARCQEKNLRDYPDYLDESYATIHFEVDVNGRCIEDILHMDSIVNVLPLSYHIPQKWEAKLRGIFRKYKTYVEKRNLVKNDGSIE